MPLKLYLRGDIWHYRGTAAGRRLRGTTGVSKPNKETALHVIAEIEARAWKGRLHGPAAVLTFAQAAILYRAARKPARYLDKIEDYWRDRPVREINAGAIRQSCQALYPQVGPATWNRAVIVPTQAIINHAAEAELCPNIRVKRFSIAKHEREPATWGWIVSFMGASSPHLASLACFMFLTGARISEALAVTWADINLGTGRSLIRQTKTRSERWAHLPPALVAALANIPGDRTGKVFRYSSGDTVTKPWARAIKRAGIKHLTPHCCRHGFATSMLRAGVDVVTVAKLGGWKSPQHVFATYGHASDDLTLTDRLTQSVDTTPVNALKYKAMS